MASWHGVLRRAAYGGQGAERHHKDKGYIFLHLFSFPSDSFPNKSSREFLAVSRQAPTESPHSVPRLPVDDAPPSVQIHSDNDAASAEYVAPDRGMKRLSVGGGGGAWSLHGPQRRRKMAGNDSSLQWGWRGAYPRPVIGWCYWA